MQTADITLLFPDNTQVRLTGDPNIIKQIIGFIDGKNIGYIKHELVTYSEASYWDTEAIKKIKTSSIDPDKTFRQEYLGVDKPGFDND